MIVAVALAGALALGPLVPGPAPASGTVRPGDSGAAVLHLQKRLRALRYDPGDRNGRYGKETEAAVWAFQKVHRMRPDGIVDAPVRRALERPRRPRRLERGPRRRVEISLRRQLLTVYRRNRPVLISHISSGNGRPYCERGVCGVARTPTGDFRVFRRVKGWHRSRLGYMYRPLYFHGGFAMHGSMNVPRRPASHGCVRVPLHTADRLARLVPNGTHVRIRR
ncbi:L,D-transpeptidase family protein [Actinomadura kijaniata]|uniref:L,D-transpeptidase family protein n=1 Tax=Actinomadura kijaniata TaxID=46161 RepID=UPI000831CC23|nr:L,D-transpeptidase family protein [Actinomadura kijaniata]